MKFAKSTLKLLTIWLVLLQLVNISSDDCQVLIYSNKKLVIFEHFENSFFCGALVFWCLQVQFAFTICESIHCPRFISSRV